MSSPDTNKAFADESAGMPFAVLPAGYALAEFRIERVIGKGGFGVVYLAFDTQLKRLVAIKEFMPQTLAQRLGDHSVVPISERHRPTFELGLRSFIREACSIAKFKHPSLVEVYRFWEELGTAYMVMPFYEGQTLKQRLDSMASPPPEPWLRQMLERVLQGLNVVHQQGWLHRDIAPDNILLLPGDRPVLLDFGSAKQDIGDATQAMAGLLKPGYAPFEQYSDSPSLKQGPWTDLYALGALLYFSISGKVPLASVARVDNDAMVSAVRLGRRRYSKAFLQFIDHCLAVWPEQRPRSIGAAVELLDRLDAQENVRRLRKSRGKRRILNVLGWCRKGLQGSKSFLARQPRLPLGGGLAALLVAAGGLTWWAPWSEPAVPMAEMDELAELANKGAVMPAQPDVSASLPSPYSPSPPVMAEPETTVSSLALPPAGVPLPDVAPVRFTMPASPAMALDHLVHARDPSIQVVVSPASDKPKDKSQLTVRASEPGYLYVFATGAQPERLELLWPSNDESLLKIQPGQVWKIDAMARLAEGGSGKREIGVMVSRSARHLAGAGWQQQAGVLNMSFANTPATAAAPWFGNAICAPVPGPCDAGFGAARLDFAYSPPPAAVAAAVPPPKVAKRPHSSPARQVAARKAECESLSYLLAMDSNTLAQRRFKQLGCRR